MYVTAQQLSVGTEQLLRDLLEALIEFAPENFLDRALRARYTRSRDAAKGPHLIEAHDFNFRAALRELLADEWVFGGGPSVTLDGPREFDEAGDIAFEDEMQALGQTAQQLGLRLAVHTGAAEGCKQALRAAARSLEHCYLIDDEGITMAEKAGAFLVPTMQMTRADKALLKAGKLPEQAVWKFRRDVTARRRKDASHKAT